MNKVVVRMHDAAVSFFAKSKPVLFNAGLTLAVMAVFSLLPDAALAGGNAISTTICTVIGQLTGPVGRGIAVIAVVFLGFSLFLGKISWGLAIALAIGIAAIFGANEIVTLLGAGGAAGC
jgi:type IV secretory pathway VirB2 component (pilin)